MKKTIEVSFANEQRSIVQALIQTGHIPYFLGKTILNTPPDTFIEVSRFQYDYLVQFVKPNRTKSEQPVAIFEANFVDPLNQFPEFFTHKHREFSLEMLLDFDNNLLHQLPSSKEVIMMMCAKFSPYTRDRYQIFTLPFECPDFPQSRSKPNYFFKIQQSDAYLDESLPRVLLVAGQHGDEPMPIYTLMELTRRLIDYLNDPTNILPVKLLILPVANPSGYDQFISSNGCEGRKNRNIVPFTNNTIGVNTNRNFTFHTMHEHSFFEPSHPDYGGVEPFSEPETQNIRSIINSDSRIKFVVDLHSDGNKIYYPRDAKDGVVKYSLSEDFKTRNSDTRDKAKKQVENLLSIIDSEFTKKGYDQKLTKKPELGNPIGTLEDYCTNVQDIPACTIEIGHSKTPMNMSQIIDIYSSALFDWLISDDLYNSLTNK